MYFLSLQQLHHTLLYLHIETSKTREHFPRIKFCLFFFTTTFFLYTNVYCIFMNKNINKYNYRVKKIKINLNNQKLTQLDDIIKFILIIFSCKIDFFFFFQYIFVVKLFIILIIIKFILFP